MWPAIETIPEEKFGSLNALRGEVCRAIFDPAVYPTKLNQRAGDDLLLTSSSNYYDGVSQAEAERFYAEMAAAAAGDPEPVSYGLRNNSRPRQFVAFFQEIPLYLLFSVFLSFHCACRFP